MTAIALRAFRLPWDEGVGQDRAFLGLALISVVAALTAAVVLDGMKLRVPVEEVLLETPERYARILLPPTPPQAAPPEPPPPAPRTVAESPPPEPVVVPEEIPEVVPPPPIPQPDPEPPTEVRVADAPPAPVPPVPIPAPVDRAVEAREEAEAAGLLPLADAFASLRDNASLGSVTAAQARIGRVGAAERSERALVAGRVATRSEGVRTSEVSIEAGGAGLDGRETTRVVSTVAANGAAVAGGGTGGRGASDPNARSREEVERVFDRNKGAIYALYDRALRQDPTVQGKFVVQLVIEPDGEVSEVEVLSSELGDAELERRLLQRIRMFRFEPRAVTRVVMTKPIDFFPV